MVGELFGRVVSETMLYDGSTRVEACLFAVRRVRCRLTFLYLLSAQVVLCS